MIYYALLYHLLRRRRKIKKRKKKKKVRLWKLSGYGVSDPTPFLAPITSLISTLMDPHHHQLHSLHESILIACRRSPEGADLLISAFVHALRSRRRSSVCTPFPNALFLKEGDKDFSSVEEAVRNFPDIHRFSPSTSGGGQGEIFSESVAKSSIQFQEVPLESLKLLHWLLRYRYEIQLVVDPADELSNEVPVGSFWGRQRFDGGSGPLPDYVLRVQEREQRIDKASLNFSSVKSEFGSIMAFHGTSAENLHSILRCGLIILSNTTLQRNGAIFGEGVYLSTDPGVALGFSKVGHGWEHSCFGQRVKYLLLCEVAKGDKVLLSEQVKSSSSNGSTRKNLGTYVVVQNSDLVKLRYIFVYMEPLKLGVHDGTREYHSTQLPPLLSRFLSLFQRIDWCKMLILIYVALLLAIGYLKSSVSKHGQRFPESRK